MSLIDESALDRESSHHDKHVDGFSKEEEEFIKNAAWEVEPKETENK